MLCTKVILLNNDEIKLSFYRKCFFFLISNAVSVEIHEFWRNIRKLP